MPLYTLGVRLYALAIRLASLRDRKARQWVRGRRDWRNALAARLHAVGDRPRIWVHCASYGEFEQGRPLMERLKAQYPRHALVLSFFSPSGYEAFSDWGGADVICYLPLDTRRNASAFIGMVCPSVAFFIKYEFWVNFLFALQRREIPAYLVSAVFKRHHPFFKRYGGIFRRSLRAFRLIFVQEPASAALLDSIGITNVMVTGDTRFDRVLEIRSTAQPVQLIERFRGEMPLLVAGSTWPGDEALLLDAMKHPGSPPMRLVLVPHHVDEKDIAATVALVQKRQLRAGLFSRGELDCDVLVVDRMGLLSRIYGSATFAYVGGGMNEGIHNTLEPAVYGIPVLYFDSDVRKYIEAGEMTELGAAFPVKDAKELAARVTQLSEPGVQAHIKTLLADYFGSKGGVTERVLAASLF